MNNKILFILSVPPPYGGGEIVSQYLYEQIKDDFECIIYPWKYYAKIRRTHFNFMSYLYGIYYIFRNIFNIIRKKPESIYIGLPKTFIAFCRNAIIIWFSNLLKINVYCEIHGMSFPFAEKPSWKRTILRKILLRISKIRVLSDSTGKYLKELGFSGSIYKINNGIYRPKVNRTNKNSFETLNLLYLGGISKSKGFHRVLNVINNINLDDRSSIHLNVVGSFVNSNEENEFVRYINENNLTSFITFHGHNVDKEKWDLILQNQMLIHLTSFDGQPLTIIECMSLGIPTIATKVGGIPEMIDNRKNGFLIDSEEEAIKVIKDILSDNIALSELSKNSQNTFKDNYTVEKMVNGIINMVKN